MNRQLQRRMSISRRLLNRSRFRVDTPPPPADPPPAPRPLTDEETQDLVEHDTEQFLRRARKAHARG